jgi:hypothetical protein
MIDLITEKQGLSDFTFDISKKIFLIIDDLIKNNKSYILNSNDTYQIGTKEGTINGVKGYDIIDKVNLESNDITLENVNIIIKIRCSDKFNDKHLIDFTNGSSIFNNLKNVDNKYTNINLNFNIYLKEDLDLKKTSILKTIAHETNHIYQSILVYNKGNDLKTFYKKNAIYNLFTTFKIKEFEDFIKVFYYTINTELDARIAQVYYEIRNNINDTSTDREIEGLIKQTIAYQQYEIINNFNSKEFVDKNDKEKLLFETNKFIKLLKPNDKLLNDINELFDYFFKWEKYFKNKMKTHKNKLFKMIPELKNDIRFNGKTINESIIPNGMVIDNYLLYIL